MKKSNINVIIVLFLVIILSCILGTIEIVKNLKEGMEDDVPPCYSTLHDKHASFNEDDEDKYILKTKIVPPKGTACPIDLNKNSNDTNKIEAVALDSSSLNTTSTSFTNITTPGSNTNDNTNANANKNNSTKPTSNIPTPNDTSVSKYGNYDKAQNSDKCPPCPACERCPESAFECKKVPNYRSQSVNQYLPMPILNDFSQF